jgi:hypothetical protein
MVAVGVEINCNINNIIITKHLLQIAQYKALVFYLLYTQQNYYCLHKDFQIHIFVQTINNHKFFN